MQYCIAEFQKTKRHAANITICIVSIFLQDKQSRNENSKKDDPQVNTYDESEANKSTEETASEKKENASEQTGTCLNDIARSYYLNNLPLISTLLGKHPSKKMVMDQLAHTNHAGVEKSRCQL